MLLAVAALCVVFSVVSVVDDSDAAADYVSDVHYDVSLKPGESYRSANAVAGHNDAASWTYDYVKIIDDDGCTGLSITSERTESDLGTNWYLVGIIDTAGSYDVHVQSKAWIEADSRNVIRNVYFHFTVAADSSGGSSQVWPCVLNLDAGDSGSWKLTENFVIGSGINAYADFDLSTITPVRAGYEFRGWALSEGGSVIATSSYQVVGDVSNGWDSLMGYSVTLFAIFTEIYVPDDKCLLTVYFDTCGGSAASPLNYYADPSEPHVFDLSERISERDGYSFVGWSLSEGGSVVSKVAVEGVESGYSNTIVYAVWKESSGAAGIKDFLGDAADVLSSPGILVGFAVIVLLFAFIARGRA